MSNPLTAQIAADPKVHDAFAELFHAERYLELPLAEERDQVDDRFISAKIAVVSAVIAATQRVMREDVSEPSKSHDAISEYELGDWMEKVRGAIFYARAHARSKGYALAVHGTLRRDVDVVAVPWTAEACDPDELVASLVESLIGVGLSYEGTLTHAKQSREEKPFGRLAYSIPLKGIPAPYLDLSVAPRSPAAALEGAAVPPAQERENAKEARWPTRDLLVKCLQESWDDYCGDTGCFPDAFEITRGRGKPPTLTARFDLGGNWILNAAEMLARRGAPVPAGEWHHCDWCSIRTRDLSATAHNLANSVEHFIAGHEVIERLARKAASVRRSLAACAPELDSHFAAVIAAMDAPRSEQDPK